MPIDEPRVLGAAVDLIKQAAAVAPKDHRDHLIPTVRAAVRRAQAGLTTAQRERLLAMTVVLASTISQFVPPHVQESMWAGIDEATAFAEITAALE